MQTATQRAPFTSGMLTHRLILIVFSQSCRHVDIHKVYTVLLGNLYKTLYNIGMRRQAEKEDPMVKAVLEKRERSDVAMDESLLSALDREVIAGWELKEEKLTVLEMRVEESVFVLRDLGTPGIDDD